MGHIGLTPQAINAIGKVRVQGKTREQARALLARRARRPGGRRLRGGPRARAGAAGGGDHGAPAHPDDRDRGRRRLRRADPGDHRRPRPGLLRARATPARTPTCAERSWRPRPPIAPTSRRAPSPATQSRRRMDDDGPRRGARPGDRRPGRDRGFDRRGDPARPRPVIEEPEATAVAAPGVPSRPAGRPLVVRSRGELAAALAGAPRPLGLVPTMGWLHAGHRSLIARARAENATVAVSIFVNPRQFGSPADIERYPRNEARDLAICAEEGVDLVWAPAVGRGLPARVRHDRAGRRGLRAARGCRAPGPLRRRGDGGRGPPRAGPARARLLRHEGRPAAAGHRPHGDRPGPRRPWSPAPPCASPTAWR